MGLAHACAYPLYLNRMSIVRDNSDPTGVFDFTGTQHSLANVLVTFIVGDFIAHKPLEQDTRFTAWIELFVTHHKIIVSRLQIC